MPAFLVTTHLPPARARRAPTCKARPPRKRSARRGNSAQSRRSRPPAGEKRPPDNDLTAQFQEDVDVPLVPGRRNVTPEEGVRLGKILEEYDPRKMTRDQTLEFLVKGAWVGIGVLVGYFFVVHFVIVKDFLPR